MPKAIPQTFEEINESVDKTVNEWRYVENMGKAYNEAIEYIVELEKTITDFGDATHEACWSNMSDADARSILFYQRVLMLGKLSQLQAPRTKP